MTLREAAQQALWALDKYYANWNHGEPVSIAEEETIEAAIAALRAALDEVLPDNMTEGELAAYRAGWEKRSLIEPQRKPLSDEEMRECAQAMDAEPLAEGWPELIKFARAVEAAHGIGGSNE